MFVSAQDKRVFIGRTAAEYESGSAPAGPIITGNTRTFDLSPVFTELEYRMSSMFVLQAALTSLVSLACVSVLYTIQPFREETDNAVTVSGQALVFLWIYMLLLRIFRVGQGGAMFFGCVALVLATIGLFAFAVIAINTQIKITGASAKDAALRAEESAVDQGAVSEESAGPVSPQATEEVGVTVVSDDNERLGAATSNTVRSGKKSPWEFLGLCTAELESKEDFPTDEHGSNATVTALLARLDAQSETICEQGKEISRLKARHTKA